MPVTIITANHPSKAWNRHRVETNEKLLTATSPGDSRKCSNIIQSSISRRNFREEYITPTKNGFVNAAFEAYGGHHHLTIRPEDVWFAVLSQLSFYINAHAEELRSFFVAHEGRKELWVEDVGSIKYMDFGAMAQRMTDLIQENVKTPELRTWIMPSFTTTTDCDRTVASILMMGSMQKYFSYGMRSCCGIPSVTLLGEQEDWKDILQRLDTLPQLGEEPAVFADLLRPILRRFIAFFDGGEPDPEFWGRIAHRHSSMSGFSGYLTGWLPAFCFWNADGKLLYNISTPRRARGSHPNVILDGVTYPTIAMEDIPSGFVSVPVTVDDNGDIYHTRMVAGSLGVVATSHARPGSEDNQITDDDDGDSITAGQTQVEEASETPFLDSLRPLTGWLMYETNEVEEGHIKQANQVPPLASSSSAAQPTIRNDLESIVQQGEEVATRA